MGDYIFYDIIQGATETTFVHRYDIVSVFMTTQPVNPGHVIPNKHTTYLVDLDHKDGSHMFRIAQ